MGQGPGTELLDVIGANAGDLGLGDAGIVSEGADQVVHRPGGDAVDVGLHDHRVQSPVEPPAAFEQSWEERPRAQLRDLRLDVTDRGRDRLGAVPVAVRGAALGALVAVGADRRRGFGLDQCLQAGTHEFGEHGLGISGQQCVELGVYARMGMGHRVVCPLL